MLLEIFGGEPSSCATEADLRAGTKVVVGSRDAMGRRGPREKGRLGGLETEDFSNDRVGTGRRAITMEGFVKHDVEDKNRNGQTFRMDKLFPRGEIIKSSVNNSNGCAGGQITENSNRC